MDLALWAYCVSGFTSLAVCGFVVLRLRAYRAAQHTSQGSSAEFLPARYDPLEWLLCEDDIRFLEAQPGYRPEIGAKLRRERRRIFGLYLRELSSDFHRLHAEARRLVANAPEEYSDLVGVLLRQQVMFWRAMAAIEVRLALKQIGVGTVDVQGLVAAIAGMQAEIQRMTRPMLVPSLETA